MVCKNFKLNKKIKKKKKPSDGPILLLMFCLVRRNCNVAQNECNCVYDFQHFQALSKFNNSLSKHSVSFGLAKSYKYREGFRNGKILKKCFELCRYELGPSGLFLVI